MDKELSQEIDRLSKGIDTLALEIDGLRQKLVILEEEIAKRGMQRWD